MYNPEANVKYKDLPNLTPMFGNLGNSWNNPLPNDLYIKNVPKSIFRGGNFVGNNGTGLDTVLTVPFPAKSLKSTDDLFRATIGGGVLSNDDNKRVRLEFGGVVLYESGSLDIDAFGFFLDLLVVRRSNVLINAILCIAEGQVLSDSTPTLTSTGGIIATRSNNLSTVNNMDTQNNDLVLLVESSSATNNNVFWNVCNIELTRS